MSETTSESPAVKNTDREIWRKGNGDGNGMSHYEPTISVTSSGEIAINDGGYVITLPVEEWHRLAVQKVGDYRLSADRTPAPVAVPEEGGLLALLLDLNERGEEPTIAGVDAAGRAFLAVLVEQGGDEVHPGLIWDDQHCRVYSLSGDTDCDDCGCQGRGPDDLGVATYPVTVLAPRPEPVVAPLLTEAVEAALSALADAAWQGAHDQEQREAVHDARLTLARHLRLVPEDDEPAVIAVHVDQRLNRPTFVRIERQGEPLVIGYVHPQPPPEDDEDTVRVPPTDIADAIVEGCTHGADHPEVDAFAPCGRCLAAALIARDYR